ncbi:c-type cytochrome [Sulfurimonas sp.]|uniref:c-type cytochrome n=1 Tax=Sulfurimonas sp. TaxID=2022749 RepID=UPI002637BCD2|nr:c-type cytochrome [Sulfurimonas sp.]
MKYIFFLTLPLLLSATSTFITPMEYASQLYENPRGIGCQKCHGKNGEGKVIATYIYKKKKKSFVGPAINSVSFKDFDKALNKRKKGMPRYYLTNKEVEALYFYLHKNDKKKKTDAQ